MQVKSIFSAVLASALLIGAAQARDFRVADVNPLDHPTVMTVKKIGDIIRQKTGSKYNVRIYGNGALGSEKDTLELVKMGALDMVRVNSTTFHGIVPESTLPAFPFVFRDIKHFRATMNGAQGDRILAAFEKSGFVGLVFWEAGSQSLYAKKPIRNLSDLKGMRLSVPQSDLWLNLVQVLGAIPTTPTTGIHTALKGNQLDAAEGTLAAYEASRLFEVAPFYSSTQHIMAPDVLVFSKKIWDTLTQDEQKLVRESVRETLPYYVDLWSKKEAIARDNARKAGATFVDDVNRAEFSAAMKPVWDKLANRPELKEMLQEIVDAK